MKNNEPSVSIVLLNYNSYKDTLECIKSLSSITYSNYKIIIVDNNSSDNSELKIKEYIKGNDRIHFIQSGKNLGFSWGNNVGIKYALEQGCKYICLLNNDTVVEPNFLEHLVRSMEQDDSIGISTGKIMYFNNKNIIWSAGGFIDYKKALGCHYGINCEDNDTFNKEKSIEFATGCLQLISKKVIEDVGLYDEKYFLYMEDVDYCHRVKQSGYKIKYVPKSKIYHKVSASTGGSESPITIYYCTRNRLMFNKKYKTTITNSMKFYSFWLLKLIAEPIRKGKKFKYSLKAIKDHNNKNYGYQELEF